MTSRHVTRDIVGRYLEARTDAHGSSATYLVLEAGETAWSSGGVVYRGPAVVHYWRLRDDGSVLSRQVPAVTARTMVTAAGGHT